MWTNENHARYDRSRLRDPSDLTGTEWAHVASGRMQAQYFRRHLGENFRRHFGGAKSICEIKHGTAAKG